MKALLLILMIGLLSNCVKFKNTDDRHQILTICNQLDRDIYFMDGELDGSLTNYSPVHSPERYLIKAHDCQDETDWGFEDIIERADSNRLTYYFFDAKVLKTVPWDTVYARKMFLVRHYTKPMLDSLNWRIVFP